jgi:NitT/TauT family transport system substrate-binding protein
MRASRVLIMRQAAFALMLGMALLQRQTMADAATVTVGKASPTADNMIPVNVGAEVGIFKKHGLDLKIVDFAGGSKMAQAMAAGSLDLAIGAGSEMALVAKGAPMLAVCEDEGTFPFLSIGVPWDSPARSASDLKGKNIGITSPGSLTDWMAKELARHEGWPADAVERVAVGGATADTVAAFRSHLVDAYIGPTSLFLDLAEKRIGRLLLPVTDFEGDMAAGDIYASTAFIAKDPDSIRAFLSAWQETIVYMRAHKEDAVRIETSITGFSPTVMGKEYDLTIGMFRESCRFDKEALAKLGQAFVDQGLLSTPPDMAKLYTEAFVPE